MSPFLVAGPFAAPAANVGDGEGTLGYQLRLPEWMKRFLKAGWPKNGLESSNHPTFRTGLINTLFLRVVGQPSGLAIFFGQ